MQQSIHDLQFLSDFLTKIKSDDYIVGMDNISFSGSIGQHSRHIVEFYEQFLMTYQIGEINYDLRKRNPTLELNHLNCIGLIDDIISKLNHLDLIKDMPIKVTNNFSDHLSTVGRELMFLNEHAVHHLALIRIIAESKGYSFHEMENFGISNSTLLYRKSN